MDSAEEQEFVSTRRTTRSGRTIASPPEKPKTRKTRKKVVMEVELSEEEEEAVVAETEASDPLEDSKENNDEEEKYIITSETDNAVGGQTLTANSDDSNSMINDFNSFKGAESSTDVQNNESSSFDVQQFNLTEEASMEMNGNTEVNPLDQIVEKQTDDLLKNASENGEDVEMTCEDDKRVSMPDPDAENISEDELPTVQPVKVPETEEVSDEELPGPKRAELPADTEVVSEEELDSLKDKKEGGTKRKIEEVSAGEDAKESKKVAVEKPIESEEAKEKPKKLPELDKYWKAVNDDPSDFTGWTYLLQYVDQENDMEAAREAYDAFLSHYPYCYGYWRKYADYEKRKGNKKKCEEVFERGLKAIPLSVDLWIHYLTYVRVSKADDEEFVRAQFERSLNACGLEFRSDRLWENYIKWESEGKRLQNVTGIFDRLLATPTQGYLQHFDNFQEHVQLNSPQKILGVDEFLALRKEVKGIKKQDQSANNPDIPPGEDTEENSDEEAKLIRERILSSRRKIHKVTSAEVTARWNFEEGIKRPYFHVKPLERCQLKNWQEYLDFEISKEDEKRIVVLFERCLIACALYEEFWLRYVHYLQSLKKDELLPKIKDIFERACTIHHLKKPNVHLQWAIFEELCKNYNKAAEILQNLDKTVPNLLQVAYRRINLERRRGDHEKCISLFEHYINNNKNKTISSNLAIKYARFTLRILKNIEKATEILNSAITKDPINSRLYLQLIDITLQKENIEDMQTEIITIIDNYLNHEAAEADQKMMFAQRKLEYLEDFGGDIECVQKAYDELQKYVKASKENKKKEAKGDSKKDKASTSAVSTTSNSYNNYGNYGNSTSGSYQYGNSQQYGQYAQYGNTAAAATGDQYQYGWQQYQSNYSGYNQWGSYGTGYGY